MMRYLLCYLLFVSLAVADSNQAYFEQGKNLGEVPSKPTNPKSIPGYEGTPHYEKNVGSLENQAKEAMKSEGSIADFVTTPSDQKYTIDPDHDPLIKEADAIVNNPEGSLGVYEETVSETKSELHKCYEGEETSERTCRRTYHIVPKIIPGKKITERYCDGHWKSKARGTKKYCEPGCKERVIRETPKQVSVENEYWSEDGNLADQLDQGECEEISRKCIDSQNPKVIEGEPFNAHCWAEEITYQCSSKRRDTCQALRQKGCYQVSSKCHRFEGEKCVEWEQTYDCQKGQTHQTRLQGESAFCLDGDCHKVSWTPNQDMAEALSKLSVLNAMKSDMSEDKVTVFQGKDLKCSRNPAGFKNCCVKKGWGMKIGLAGCSDDEKTLAIQRGDDKCVYVGTYCHKKIGGVCVEKKSSFCCFGSKLSKIIHEQGRKLLGKGWGDPKCPDCSGFTISQFTQIDLSKIDFSSLYQEIMTKVQSPDMEKTKVKAEAKIHLKQEKTYGGL